MDRFEWSSVALAEGEDFVRQQAGVKIQDGSKETAFTDGTLVLTNSRLLWSQRGSSNMQCIALSLALVVYSEEVTAAGGASSLVLHLQPVTSTGAVTRKPVAPASEYSHVSLIFSQGGLVELSRLLIETLSGRKWERTAVGRASVAQTAPRAGIAGIEKVIQQKQKETDKSIAAAFEDMRNLMGKAKEMVTLAKAISAKIREKQGNITDDETTQFKSYLLSLGISDPVTRDTYGSGNKYYLELARELATVLLKPLQECGGVMALTDVYCRVNRARGLELLSPQDLLEACRTFETASLPLRLKTYESGVMVVILVSQSEEQMAKEAAKLVEQNKSMSADELSSKLGISVVLAKERLLLSERYGCLCRDDSVEGLRFYPNLFVTCIRA